MPGTGTAGGGGHSHRLRDRIYFAGLGSMVAIVLGVAANPKLKPIIEGLLNSGWMYFWLFVAVLVWLSMVSTAVVRSHNSRDAYFFGGFGGISLPYMTLDALVRWVQ